MAFIGVQFSEGDGTGVGLVLKEWLSPNKGNAWYPPYNKSSQFNKCLRTFELPDKATWELCAISKCHFATDDISKARRKLMLLEEQSDVQTEIDELPPKRKRKARCISSDDTDDDFISQKNFHPRPPPLQLNSNVNSQSQSSIAFNKSIALIHNTASESSVNLNKRISDGNSIITIRNTPSPTTSGCSTPITSNSRDINSVEDFKKLMTLLIHIRHQNDQILTRINQNSVSPLTVNQLPVDLPVHLPITTIEEIQKIENYLEDQNKLSALVSYFSSLGGKDIITKTNLILKRILSNSIAKEFSFLGTRNNKKCFSKLLLQKVVIEAVGVGSPSTTEVEICNAIKVWLKHSSQRLSHENRRKQHNDRLKLQ
ncbi:hypothetical protein RN001_003038 [Aquatica leii]|uniref:DUF4806 domain-containing protein n=1 Tax=Aquatica leii TaxID=1421715 RepID=A0AAN7PHQ4_9COLE|nr:hypothetical protein RN001_003038 [Aquatica leii]